MTLNLVINNRSVKRINMSMTIGKYSVRTFPRTNGKMRKEIWLKMTDQKINKTNKGITTWKTNYKMNRTFRTFKKTSP